MDFLRELVESGGPKPEDYMMIDSFLSLLADNDEYDNKMPPELHEIIKSTLTEDTMHGFARSKPHGYSGDFEMT